MDHKMLAALFFLSAVLCAPAAAADIAAAHRDENAAANAAEIIEMRSALARTIEPGAEVTEETFRKVCGAVVRRAKQIMEAEGVTIRHASERNRNPANAATSVEAALIKRFEGDTGLKEAWDEVTVDGREYRRYARPIYVEKACLACHGDRESMPKFIKEKYPEDRAHGYKTGDLRGIISVLVPE